MRLKTHPLVCYHVLGGAALVLLLLDPTRPLLPILTASLSGWTAGGGLAAPTVLTGVVPSSHYISGGFSP